MEISQNFVAFSEYMNFNKELTLESCLDASVFIFSSDKSSLTKGWQIGPKLWINNGSDGKTRWAFSAWNNLRMNIILHLGETSFITIDIIRKASLWGATKSPIFIKLCSKVSLSLKSNALISELNSGKEMRKMKNEKTQNN